VDRIGHQFRHQQIIQRRTYKVKHSNALWHLDGHHKTIRWRFLVHGFIDSYCKMVCH
ncbi:hypothetical protein CY34DRAFT_40029, partial [Suillus luteus UH-Slu-Lm8-n1]